MTRFNSRSAAAAVVLLLLAAAAAGSTPVWAEAEPGHAADAQTINTQVLYEGADGSESSAEVIIRATDETDVDDTAQHGSTEAVKSREELLAEWDALNQERQQLMGQLQAVHRDMQSVAYQLWSYELEEARQRIREQLNEYGGEYGEDVLEWLPPRLIDGISDLTGRAPDELQDIIRDGAWGELF